MDQPMDQSTDEPRVDEVLQQLRAGVRQRQAELATVGRRHRRGAASSSSS